MQIAGFKIGVIELFAAIAITLLAFFASGHAKEFGQYSYIGVFLITLISSATILFPAPGWAVVIGLSTTLDPVLLGIAAGLGSGIGEITGYLLGAGSRNLVLATPDKKEKSDKHNTAPNTGKKGMSDRQNASNQTEKMEKPDKHRDQIIGFVQKYADLGIFALAFIPNPLFDIAGFAAGAINMPWYRFLIATTCGKILRYIVFLAVLGTFSHWLF